MKYSLILCLLCGFIACQEEQPELFSSDRYIKLVFEENPDDQYYVTNFTFAFEDESVNEKVFRFPVEFRGNSLTEDLPFRLEVTDSLTSLPADAYNLELEQLFHAGQGNKDSLTVSVARTDALNEGTKILRFTLVDNENFLTYMQDSIYIEIRVSNTISRPDWWPDGGTVDISYLGKYSNSKYLAFVEATGIQDFGSLDSSEKRHYAIIFKRALEANPRIDEDGSTMSVTIAG